jgi:cyanophycinase
MTNDQAPMTKQIPNSKSIWPCCTLLAAFVCTSSLVTQAQDRAGGFPWIDPDGIRGSLVICGGGALPDEVRTRFVDLAGGQAARVVVIPTASATAEATIGDPRRLERLLAPWKSHGAADVQMLHTRSKEKANDDAFVGPLKAATAVWFGGGDQSKIAEAYLGTAVEREIGALLARGGVVGGTSAGAAIQSKVMIAGGQTEPRIAVGLDLLPGAIIDQHFLARKRRDRLVAAVAKQLDCVGYGIDEGTALVVHGRRLEVLGKSTVTVSLAGSGDRAAREFELKNGDEHDLTMLRRAALERKLVSFPPKELPAPRLQSGSLVIAGGGRLSAEVTNRFIELAGGPESPIVVLPIAAGDTLRGDSSSDTRLFERAGAKNVKSLRARKREEVESPEFAAALNEAKGVWFGGGRQWRFVDAYMGTKAEELLRGVLRRGGVIGGSSAGASIQAQYLVRGSPLGNTEMMAEGYERGIGFLPAAAVDQHFTQRERHSDMTQVMQRYPKLLGIGIDERTAVVVQGETAVTIGRGNAHFYDYRSGPPKGERDYMLVQPGQRFDLVERRIVTLKEPD